MWCLSSKKVESIVVKGENADSHHFLLLPQFFKKPSNLKSLKFQNYFEITYMVRDSARILLTNTQFTFLMSLKSKRTLMGKEEYAGHQHFHLFPRGF